MQGQPLSRGAQTVGRDNEEDAEDAEDGVVATAEAEAARLAAAGYTVWAAAAKEAAREKAEREARRAGAEEAAALEASRRLAVEETRTRADAAEP